MKILVFIGAFLPCLALSKPVQPQNYRCEELQEAILEGGELFVIYGLLGWSRGTVYSPEVFEEKLCRSNRSGHLLRVRTIDRGNCDLGYICKKDRD